LCLFENRSVRPRLGKGSIPAERNREVKKRREDVERAVISRKFKKAKDRRQ